MLVNNFSLQKAAIEKENYKRYSDVYAHELAHKSVAGSFGGSIVIDKNPDGLIVGGHVDIKMPGFNPKNPQESKNHAEVVFKAAMAPHDPSTQDYKVAAEAQQIINRANKAIYDNKVGKKLDITG